MSAKVQWLVRFTCGLVLAVLCGLVGVTRSQQQLADHRFHLQCLTDYRVEQLESRLSAVESKGAIGEWTQRIDPAH